MVILKGPDIVAPYLKNFENLWNFATETEFHISELDHKMEEYKKIYSHFLNNNSMNSKIKNSK